MNTVSPYWVEHTPSKEGSVHTRFGVDSLDDAMKILTEALRRDPQLSDPGIFEGGGVEMGAGYRHYGPLGADWVVEPGA